MEEFNKNNKPVKCKAKDPLKCRYHGIKNFASLDKNTDTVLEAVENRMSFIINRQQRIKTLLETYEINNFLKPEDYTNAISLQGRLLNDKAADKFYIAESQRQYDWAEANMENFPQIKQALSQMTIHEHYNIHLRNATKPTELEKIEKHNFIINFTDKAFEKIPSRKLNNRLFRGISFDSKKSFNKWLKLNTITGISNTTYIKLEEFIRTSAHSERAFSFATTKNYSVIMEVITKSGLYLNNFSTATAHEAEVLLNRKKPLLIEGIYQTTVYDMGQNRNLTIIKLRDTI